MGHRCGCHQAQFIACHESKLRALMHTRPCLVLSYMLRSQRLYSKQFTDSLRKNCLDGSTSGALPIHQLKLRVYFPSLCNETKWTSHLLPSPRKGVHLFRRPPWLQVILADAAPGCASMLLRLVVCEG